MLSSGSKILRGQVTGRKRNIDGNTTGQASDNPILETQEYSIQFEDGEVTELTENAIVESMYAQCDPDGNQYVLLDIIHFCKTNPALSIEDQNSIVEVRASMCCSTVGWQV